MFTRKLKKPHFSVYLTHGIKTEHRYMSNLELKSDS